jgi:F-type H+-transporting ATPase subunit epsilon
MADKMSFELVSPERKVATGEADMVVIPGMDGDLGAMADHAPFLTTLRPGIVKVTNGSETKEYFVLGGFVEISGNTVSVLAEQASERHEVSRETLDQQLASARAELDALDAEDHMSQRSASQRVSDLISVTAHMFD